MAGKIKKYIKHFHCPIWLGVVLVIAFIFRIPSFFEPFTYGDEMIYLSLGDAIRRGWVLYRDIHDNKPPLLYFTAALAGNVFWFRAILAFWMSATIVIFYKFVHKLYSKNDLLVKVAVVVFAFFTTIPLLEGQIANAELFMIGPTIWAFYLLFDKKLSSQKIIFAGLLLSISTLFKVPAMFDIGAIIFIWFILIFDKKYTGAKLISFIKNSLLLALSYLTPILLTFVWYYLQGAFKEYLIAAYLQNVGYLSSFRPDDVKDPFLVRNAPLLIRAALVGAGLGLLTIFRKKLSREFIFISAWLLFSYFAIALSERPYPHYIIQAIAPISILIAYVAARKNIEQVLAIIPLFIAVFVPVYYNFWYYQSVPYYTRFIKYVTHQYTKEQYFDAFEGNVNRNYSLSARIRALTDYEEPVFVWGDSSVIYALSKRLPPYKYIANYHISDFSSKEEVLAALYTNPPELIVVLPNSEPFSELKTFLLREYYILSYSEAEIWLRMGSSDTISR